MFLQHTQIQSQHVTASNPSRYTILAVEYNKHKLAPCNTIFFYKLALVCGVCHSHKYTQNAFQLGKFPELALLEQLEQLVVRGIHCARVDVHLYPDPTRLTWPKEKA